MEGWLYVELRTVCMRRDDRKRGNLFRYVGREVWHSEYTEVLLVSVFSVTLEIVTS